MRSPVYARGCRICALCSYYFFTNPIKVKCLVLTPRQRFYALCESRGSGFFTPAATVVQFVQEPAYVDMKIGRDNIRVEACCPRKSFFSSLCCRHEVSCASAEMAA